jgi:Family of unknown function (DUF5677)
MSLPPNLFTDALQRCNRFQPLFQAQDVLGDIINEILDTHPDKLQMRDGDERDLSLLVASALGKGLKTFQAVIRLCALGYGEDALILIRSTINLLINIAYILAAQNPSERVKDFLAFSYQERAKYFRLARGDQQPPWPPPVSPTEVKQRAKAWQDISLAQRADVGFQWHYTQGYRLYSSLEHADAWGLNEYMQVGDEIGPQIGSEESDKLVDLALMHNYCVLADLLLIVCKFFGIDRPDLFAKIRAVWLGLGAGADTEPSQGSST